MSGIQKRLPSFTCPNKAKAACVLKCGVRSPIPAFFVRSIFHFHFKTTENNVISQHNPPMTNYLFSNNIITKWWQSVRAKGWRESNSWTVHYKHHTHIPRLWLCVKHVSYLMWKAECFLVNLLLCSPPGVHIALKMYWPFQDYFWECLKTQNQRRHHFYLRHKQIQCYCETISLISLCNICSPIPNVYIFKAGHLVKFKAALQWQQVTVGPSLLLK